MMLLQGVIFHMEMPGVRLFVAKKMDTFGVRNPLSASEKFMNPCLSCIFGKATGEVSIP